MTVYEVDERRGQLEVGVIASERLKMRFSSGYHSGRSTRTRRRSHFATFEASWSLDERGVEAGGGEKRRLRIGKI